MLKTKLSIMGLMAGLCLSSFAHAADLTLINNTNHDSTSVMNNGPCSADILGDKGVTHAHTTNVVPSKTLNTACILNKFNCKAEVHMTKNCTGPVVATVYLDVRTGIKTIVPSADNQGYTLSGTGFTASMNGGPAMREWMHWFLG